ncbi:hypothetical protein SDJN03_06899, partial [Cucurbita argyrosperma subsp. sororia]
MPSKLLYLCGPLFLWESSRPTNSWRSFGRPHEFYCDTCYAQGVILANPTPDNLIRMTVDPTIVTGSLIGATDSTTNLHNVIAGGNLVTDITILFISHETRFHIWQNLSPLLLVSKL